MNQQDNSLDRLGVVFFDTPKKLTGWWCLQNEVGRFDGYKGVLTRPDTAWLTNFSRNQLREWSLPARFLPENYFRSHLRDILHLLAEPQMALSHEERKEDVLGRFWTIPEHPESSIMAISEFIERLVWITQIPVGGHASYALTIRKSSGRSDEILTRSLEKAIGQEIEYLTRTVGAFPKNSKVIRLDRPPLAVARGLLSTELPAGKWRAVQFKLTSRQVDDVLEHPHPVIAQGTVEIPAEYASALPWGSGNGSGLRELISTPEIAFLSSIGARIELTGRAWECLSQIKPPSLPKDPLADLSWSLGLSWQSQALSYGVKMNGTPSSSRMWLRANDRSSTWRALSPFIEDLKEEFGQRYARVLSFYLGSVWVAVPNDPSKIRRVCDMAYQRGFIPAHETTTFED